MCDLFGRKRIKELEVKNAEYYSIVTEVRRALGVKEGEDLVQAAWRIESTLQANATLLEGAAKVMKAADSWYALEAGRTKVKLKKPGKKSRLSKALDNAKK